MSIPLVQSSISEVLFFVRSTVTVHVVSVDDRVSEMVELLPVVAESTPVHCAAWGVTVNVTT